MQNIKIVASYDGTSFQGWQKQNNTMNTIQGILERTLSEFLQEDINLHGSGRTDAGVHAYGQVANFYTRTSKSLCEIKSFLNENLPDTLRILQVEEVPKDFHSRLSATHKRYLYQVGHRGKKNVFERKYMYQISETLDVEAMRKAAVFFLGTHDFKCFTSLVTSEKSTVRTIYSIDIEETGSVIKIIYDGDGFLYHMVRIITGTLIEVGLKKRNPEDMKALLLQEERRCSGFLAPANGLFLMKVYYEEAEE